MNIHNAIGIFAIGTIVAIFVFGNHEYEKQKARFEKYASEIGCEYVGYDHLISQEYRLVYFDCNGSITIKRMKK
jgi:hypothetical protein